MTNVSFGSWLKQRRKRLDLTQADLARCAGCAAVTIQKIEVDERRPSRQVAELLAACLEISPADRPTFLKVARAELRVDRLAEVTSPPLSPLPTELGPKVVTETRSSAPLPPLDVPTPFTPLIGREHELAEITQLLHHPQCRLLSLIGPGGIGKSRLALELASQQRQAFADGVYFVPLAPVSAGEFIVPAIADAIGFSFYGPTEPQVQLLNYLREKQLLLILDNLEHLLPPPHPFSPEENGQGVEIITRLLPHAPAIKLLTTSRERLNLQGEWVFEIQGLPVPPSDQMHELEAYSAALLFLQSAQRARVGFVLPPEERPAVACICRLMEGMPLGIELAAVWVRVLTCSEIAQEIERNLDFLTVSARDMPARHRSMRAVFDHSWKLLSAEEQQVMRRLSVFRGGFRREAVEQVAGTTLPLLAALVDKSLLRRTSTGRYELHELIRQYAAAHLRHEPPEEQATYDRHSHYYLTLLQEREPALQSGRQKEALAELAPEIDNIRLAWEWAVRQEQVELMRRATWPLWYFYELRNYYQEGEAVCRRGAEVVRTRLAKLGSSGAGPERAKLEGILGDLLAHQAFPTFRQGRMSEAQTLFETSVALLRPLDQPALLAHALAHYGVTFAIMGQFEESARYLQESLVLSRAIGHSWQLAIFNTFLGMVRHEQGFYTEAYQLLQEGMARSRALGDPRLISVTGSFLSRTAQVLDRAAEMQQLLHEGLQLAKETGDRFGIGLMLERLALTAQSSGDEVEARRLLAESVELYREIGDPWSLARTLTMTGHTALKVSDPIEAEQCFLTAFKLAAEAKIYTNALDALAGLALVKAQEGEAETALMLMAHILQHPASSQEAKDRAERLHVDLEAQLSPQQVEAAQRQAQAKSIEAVVQELLSHP